MKHDEFKPRSKAHDPPCPPLGPHNASANRGEPRRQATFAARQDYVLAGRRSPGFRGDVSQVPRPRLPRSGPPRIEGGGEGERKKWLLPEAIERSLD